jgi:hypothetical protein
MAVVRSSARTDVGRKPAISIDRDSLLKLMRRHSLLSVKSGLPPPIP